MVGVGITEAEKLLHMHAVGSERNTIEWVSEFSYLGSLIADDGSMEAEVDKRIATVSRAFGALWDVVFEDLHNHMSVSTNGTAICCICYVLCTAIW